MVVVRHFEFLTSEMVALNRVNVGFCVIVHILKIRQSTAELCSKPTFSNMASVRHLEFKTLNFVQYILVRFLSTLSYKMSLQNFKPFHRNMAIKRLPRWWSSAIL